MHLVLHVTRIESFLVDVVVVVVSKTHVEWAKRMDLAVHAYEGHLGVVLEVQLELCQGVDVVLFLTRVESFLVAVVVVVVVLEAHMEQKQRMDQAVHAHEKQARNHTTLETSNAAEFVQE